MSNRTSNRTLRRAAERQARKAEKKLIHATASANTTQLSSNDPPLDNELDDDFNLDTPFPPEFLVPPELLAWAEQLAPGFAADAADDEAWHQGYLRRRALRSEIPHASTGPRTQAGKEISSRNALKHGSCSTGTLILANESLDDFLALEQRWFQGYNLNTANPEAAYQAELIRTAARADWFFQRADRNYAEVEAQLLTAQPNLLQWDESQHCTLARFLRYRTTHTNTLAKHRKAVEDYRKHRAAEVATLQKQSHSNEKSALAKQRLETATEERQPETWAEHLEAMRRQAIALGFTPKPRPTDTK